MPSRDRRGIRLPTTVFAKMSHEDVLRIEEGGEIADLTGDSFEAKVVRSETSDTVIVDLEPEVLGPPTDGVVRIKKSAAEMTLTPGNYWWYWTWTNSSEVDVTPLFYGPFTIKRHP